MTHLLSFLLCLSGFTLLAISTSRQQRILFGETAPAAVSAARRLAGSCLLIGALGILAYAYGWGLGFVMFGGHTSLAAGVVYCCLIIYSKRSKRAFDVE